jgi:Zn-dependent M28 family amino/carboxypeptidase
LLSACKRAPEATDSAAEERGSPAPATGTSPAANPPPAEIWKEFSGEKAFAEVRKQVEVGPRPAGSPEIEKARLLIEESLRRNGWEVERQTFTDETPRGPIQFVNVIGRFSANGQRPVPRDTQRAIVCSHYDTKRFSTIRFVGASDGASSTGALLELARVLALDPKLAAKIELVFFDGEEAFVQFTGPDDPKPDGLYGSRHYARQLVAAKRATQFKFGILWDMIGDRDLTITLPPDSPAELARAILASAEALQLRQHFSYYDRPILDDHEPLIRIARIPTIDLIDFDYAAWHTADDTLDRLAPESLQKIGAITLHHLRKAFEK